MSYLIQRVHDPRTVLTLDLKAIFFATYVHPLVVTIVVNDLVAKLAEVESPNDTFVPVVSRERVIGTVEGMNWCECNGEIKTVL